MRFIIDKEKCIGCGACQAIAGEIFEITDEGYAEAKDIEVEDEELKENATSAMEGCPTGAIEEQ